MFFLAVLVLLGLAFDVRGLQSLIPEEAGIEANSAVAMMLGSLALLRRNHRILTFFSIAVFLIECTDVKRVFPAPQFRD